MDLQNTATTVSDLAAHMDRLRERAVVFHRDFATGDRGYFTPSEDDAVLALWVSYHKTRTALLELIDSIRHDVGEPSEESVLEFAVGYSAALVLIDAARFLREYFAEDEIVRRKLNESYDAYGIAEGSFDDIQMALTDPATALKIREATEFYDQYEDLIRDAVQQNDRVRCLTDVIDSRIKKVRVGKGRYVKALIDEQRRRLNDAVVQGGLMRALYAFQEWGSRAVSSLSTMPGHIPELPGIIQCQLQEIMQPGDVFITRKDSAVTNYFLPGYWPHAALYIGDDDVIESLKDGVRLRAIGSPFGNDAVALIRPLLAESSIAESIDRARSHVGKPYDFDFDFTRSDRIVCTEVVYRSYEGIDQISFTLTSRAGRPTLSAEDLLNLALQNRFFQLVAVYCKPKSEQLMTDQRMIEALRETMAEPAV